MGLENSHYRLFGLIICVPLRLTRFQRGDCEGNESQLNIASLLWMLANNCQSRRVPAIGTGLKMREAWGHGCSQGAHRVLGEPERDLHHKLKPRDVLQFILYGGEDIRNCRHNFFQKIRKTILFSLQSGWRAKRACNNVCWPLGTNRPSLGWRGTAAACEISSGKAGISFLRI